MIQIDTKIAGEAILNRQWFVPRSLLGLDRRNRGTRPTQDIMRSVGGAPDYHAQSWFQSAIGSRFDILSWSAEGLCDRLSDQVLTETVHLTSHRKVLRCLATTLISSRTSGPLGRRF